MSIVDKMNRIEDLGYINGCTEEQIKEAEEILDLKFPNEYVKTYGVL